MNLLPTTPTYTAPAAPATTASYYPTTPTYPAYPSTPSYGYDQYQGALTQLTTQVYDLQRVITAAGSAAYGNPSYLAALTDLQQRVGQARTMAATTPYPTPQTVALDDLANRLVRLRPYVAPQQQYYTPPAPTYYPTQPPTYYPQPGYPQQPGYARPMDPMRMQRRMERLQRREQMIHWRQQQLMQQQQQQQNPLAQIIGAFSGLTNGGYR